MTAEPDASALAPYLERELGRGIEWSVPIRASISAVSRAEVVHEVSGSGIGPVRLRPIPARRLTRRQLRSVIRPPLVSYPAMLVALSLFGVPWTTATGRGNSLSGVVGNKTPSEGSEACLRTAGMVMSVRACRPCDAPARATAGADSASDATHGSGQRSTRTSGEYGKRGRAQPRGGRRAHGRGQRQAGDAGNAAESTKQAQASNLANAMRDGPYKVVEIPETLDAPENRGARPKYWVRIGEGAGRWLLKIPRPGTGEHWAEKITAEVGHIIGVDCAQVELARYAENLDFATESAGRRNDEQRHGGKPERLATICRSFIPDERNGDEHLLLAFHGVEVLQFVVEGYDTERRFGQRGHNIRNIAAGMTAVISAEGMEPMPRLYGALEKLASYVLLDGLVANTDRHHENWMIAYVENREGIHVDVMPSFDHASSLGRELTDDNRRRILESHGVRRYLNRGEAVFMPAAGASAHPPRYAWPACYDDGSPN